jgi:hypothetical protein
MNPRHNKATTILFLLLFYLFFLGTSIFLSYWFGIGWFFLIHTIIVLLASSPRLYIPVASPFIGKVATEKLRERFIRENTHWFYPQSAIVLNLFNFLLTLLAFWKVNIPLRTIIHAVISVK